MDDEPTVDTLPPLAVGDVYLYAHRNGGIGVVYGDGRRLDVTLADARATARGAHDAGSTVWIGGDDAPLAVDALHRITEAGVPLTAFGAPIPPQTWPSGTDALISAAAHGSDPILDDLLARGADVHHRDDAGSTALHHAAAMGNTHAIEALVAHGAVIDRPNERGATPLRLAEGRGHPEAAALLRALGAPPVQAVAPAQPVDPTDPPAIADAEPSTCGRAHVLVLAVWLYPPLLLLVGLALTWPPNPTSAAVFGSIGALYLAVAPWRALAAAVAPRRFEGSALIGRRLTGASRRVDLDEVTFVGFGGSTSTGSLRSGRWILLAHPAGRKLSSWTLRRLLVPPDELDEVLAHRSSLVVVSVDGPSRAEVLLPLAARLGRDVPRTATVAAQFAGARQPSDP